MQVAQPRDEVTQALDRISATRIGNAGKGIQLADDDQQRGCVDEPDDHRMAEEIDDAAHLPQPQQPEKDTGLEAQHGGNAEVGLVVQRRVLAHGGRHHQRCHRHGPHDQVSGRTKNCVDHHGHQARVQAGLCG